MYLTFDVGTTSVKAALFNREGKLIYKVIRDYKLNSPYVDWYEVEPQIYWESVLLGFKEIFKKSGVSPDEVKTISGCSQGETVIFLDGNDRPLRPAMVWYDNRSREEVEIFKNMVDRKEYYHTTGLLELDTTPSALKILWVKRNESNIFEKIVKILLVEDYIIYKLTGNFVSSASLLTSSALIDINKKKYWDKLVDYLDIADRLPRIIEEGSIVGKVVSSIAEELGISKNVVVVKGSMDQTTGAVGAGNIKSGIITETTGSALAVAVTTDQTDYNRDVNLPYQVHVLPNKYLILPYAQTSGIVYKWFRDEFAQEEIRKSGDPEAAYGELNKIAESIPPGSEGLVFLPFLAGASFPENDKYAKGVFYGITLKHSKAHFTRAILESIGFMLKRILTAVELFGIKIEEVHSMGGAARSDLWLQIKADICGYPFIQMPEEETSTLGAAILASVKAGDYVSIEEAVDVMVKPGRKFYPHKSISDIYFKNYELYKNLYKSLKPVFKDYSK